MGGGVRRDAPEHKLLRALLCDAVVSANRARRRRRGHAGTSEAERWLADDDETWPFSFRPVCHHLGLDPEYFRATLRAEWTTGTPVGLGVARALRHTMPPWQTPDVRRRAARRRRASWTLEKRASVSLRMRALHAARRAGLAVPARKATIRQRMQARCEAALPTS